MRAEKLTLLFNFIAQNNPSVFYKYQTALFIAVTEAKTSSSSS
jgi:hypothetical protein